MPVLESFSPWGWWLAGLALLVLELTVPGTVLLWFGLAALVVGAVSLVVDWPWQAQAVAFAALSLASLALVRPLIARQATSDRPHLNRRAEALIGRKFRLIDPIVDGTGRIHVDDTVWRVRGPDAPAGTEVRVTGIEDGLLVVAPDARVS